MKPASNAVAGLVSALLLAALVAALEFLFHWLVVPALFCLLCLYLVACRVGRNPAVRRAGAAFVLLFCEPRPVDGPLFTFCFPDNAIPDLPPII
jgi:hypothetical protein